MGAARKISLDQLAPAAVLFQALHHPSGELLHAAGTALQPLHLELLAAHGIQQLYEVPPEALNDFVFDCAHQALRLGDVKLGDRYDAPLTRRDGLVMVPEGTVIGEALYRSFLRRQDVVVYRALTEGDRGLPQARAYIQAAQAVVAGPGALPKAEAGPVPSPAPGPVPAPRIEVRDPVQPRQPEAIKASLQSFNERKSITEDVFGLVRDGLKVKSETVRSLVEGVLADLAQDRQLQIHLTNIKSRDRYLIGHSTNVTVACINTAQSMGLSPDELRDVALAGIFQNVGTMKVAPAVLNKAASLTQAERLEVEKHIMYALNYLERSFKLPPLVPLLIRQTHERLDGSGYPRGLTRTHIHPYAQIVAVADVYDSLTSPRPWRQAHLPYDAMSILLHLVAEHKLDAQVVRQFLAQNNRFPIGSFVELSDGRVGRVIGTDGQHLTRPLVRVYDVAERRFGEVLDLAKEAEDFGIKVRRPLDASAWDVPFLEGF